MASTVLRLSDVIVPEVFSRYLTEESVKLTTFYRSGILNADPMLAAYLVGGGNKFQIPFWRRDNSAPQAIQSDTTIETEKMSSAQMDARRLLFAKGWSSEELAAVMSGEDPFSTLRGFVERYWEEQFQVMLFNTIKGVIGDNIDNDSGDLVNDITTSGTVGTANKISANAVIDAYTLLGDKSQFRTISMHSVVYATLQKANIISYVPTNVQDIGWGTFLGMTVVVCDELAYDTDGSNKEYTTIISQPGAIAFAESARGITPVEVDRKAEKSEDRLFTRRQLLFHPYGFSFTDSSVQSDVPEMDELKEAANWDRKFEKKNCGFVALISNG